MLQRWSVRLAATRGSPLTVRSAAEKVNRPQRASSSPSRPPASSAVDSADRPTAISTRPGRSAGASVQARDGRVVARINGAISVCLPRVRTKTSKHSSMPSAATAGSIGVVHPRARSMSQRCTVASCIWRLDHHVTVWAEPAHIAESNAVDNRRVRPVKEVFYLQLAPRQAGSAAVTGRCAGAKLDLRKPECLDA